MDITQNNNNNGIPKVLYCHRERSREIIAVIKPHFIFLWIVSVCKLIMLMSGVPVIEQHRTEKIQSSKKKKSCLV